MAREPTKLVSESHVRSQLLRFLGGYRRNVQRIGDRTRPQEVRHLLGHLDRHVLLSLLGRRAKMWCRHHLFQTEQGILPGWLVLEYVDGRSRHTASLDRCPEGFLVHQAPASAVDDPHARSATVERCRVHHVPGRVVQRHMEADEIRLVEQFIVLDDLDAQLGGSLLGEERVGNDHAHP